MDLRNTATGSLALFIAIGSVWLIERLVLHGKELSATKEGVFAIELFALVIIFGKFLMGEALKIFEKIRGVANEPESLRTRDVFNILFAVAGSMAIYLVWVHFLN
jgi:hypothetical protein